MTQAGGVNLSAAHVATAIVAAARILKTDPARVFEAGRMHPRTRILAAAGCCARLGIGKADAGRVFKVQPQRLAPSMLIKETITTEQLLEIADALEAAGLTAGAAAGERFRSPWEACPAGRDRRPCGTSRHDAPKPGRGRRTQAPAARAKPSRKSGQDGPSASRPALDASASTPAPPRAAPGQFGTAPIHPPLRRQASGQAGAAARSRARPSGPGLRAIPGLKPVSDDIARWGGYFLDARWPLETTADLFEVCPVALLDALDPQEVRA